MKKIKVMYRIFYCVGFAMSVVFSVKLNSISNEAWIYGIISVIGMFIFTTAMWCKKELQWNMSLCIYIDRKINAIRIRYKMIKQKIIKKSNKYR